MEFITFLRFTFATLLPVATCIVLFQIRKQTAVARIPNKAWQAIVGIVFGAIAIYGTEAGIPIEGAMMNVRDAAPLAAGLFFGGPAGIIAGLIGGIERWFAVYWGVGEFTRVACTLGTIFAGFYAAFLRKYLFENHIPNPWMALATGIVAEVFHLTLVFVTNMDQVPRAFAVTQACTFPMISAVGASTALSALAMTLLNRQPLVTPPGKRNVAQTLHNRMLIAVVVAFLLTIGFTTLLQTNLARANTSSLLELNINDLKGEITNASDDSQVLESVKNRHVGQTGGLAVVDEQGNVVSTRGDIRNDAGAQVAADIKATQAAKLFSTTFADTPCFAMYDEVEGYRIIALLPEEEALFSRNVTLLILAFAEVLVFATVFLVIYFAVNRAVVRNVRKVNDQLGQITNGNLNMEVDVRDTVEFASLSNDINLTVGALKTSLATVQADLDMAAEVQMSVLPTITQVISGRSEFELYASMEPAKEVGGDFYDFFLIDDDHLALVVADVSGKGVAAALFMMLSKTILKMESLSGANPAAVLERANADLSEKNDDEMFTTAWLGVLEISTGNLTYADAGHEKLALHHNGTWELPPKPNGAVALAAFDEDDYADLADKYRFRNHTIQLQPGDAIFQYTDGVTEATSTDEELFGEERLTEALSESGTASPKEVLPSVRGKISSFVKDAPQFDDITMLGLLYKGPGN